MPLPLLALLAGLGQGAEEGKERELKRRKEKLKLDAEEQQQKIQSALYANLLSRISPQGGSMTDASAMTKAPASLTGVPTLDRPSMGLPATPPQMPGHANMLADIARRAADGDPEANQTAALIEAAGIAKMGPMIDVYQKVSERSQKREEFDFRKAKGGLKESYEGPTGKYEREINPLDRKPVVIPGQTDAMGWRKVAEPEVTVGERGPYLEKRDKYGNIVNRQDRGYEEPVYGTSPATGATEVRPKYTKPGDAASAAPSTSPATEEGPQKKNIKPMAGEQAGKFSATINAIDNVQKVRERLFKDGKLDRKLVAQMTMWLGNPVPGTEGETYGRMMLDALEAQIRTESGAAIPDEEVKRNAKRHYATLLSSSDAIATGMNMLENKLQGTKRVLDPSGEYEKTVKEVQKGAKGAGAAGGSAAIDKLPKVDQIYVQQIQKMIDKGVVTLDTLTPNQMKFKQFLRPKK